MPAVNYLAEEDRIKMKGILWPIVDKMTEGELKVALLYILWGVDIYEVIESANIIQEGMTCPHGVKKTGKELHFAGAIYICRCCSNAYGTLNTPLPTLCPSCR